MNKKTSFLFFLLLISFAGKTYAQKNSTSKPNIIFFLVDDMGWQDSSVPFWDSATTQNKKFQTPNMVQFATTAEKFTNAYSTPICTPSRVSLMTGMNAARHRVTNWTAYKNRSVDARDSLLAVPKWNVNGLSPKPQERSVVATPLAQVLEDTGYFTIQCGKAHFGAYGTIGANPLNLGFTKNIGGSAAGNPASYLAEDDFGWDPNHYKITADIPNMKEYWGTKTFLTEDLTQSAMRELDTAQMLDKPFFLYMAHYAVHLPYNVDKRFIQKYIDEGYTKPEAAYCALVEGMDKSLGELLNYLEQHHLEKNTIVVFMSDNGGYSHAPREGKDNTQNYPLKGGKGSLYEGGIREPMMVRWPGVTTAGTVSKQYTIMEDFYPTLLEMAGIRHYKTIQRIDGESMVPYLKNPKAINDKRVLVWNYPNDWTGGNWGEDNSFMTAIRKGDWKLIYFEKYGRLELYNIKDDIKEQNDLAKKYPQRVKELAKLLTKKLKEEGGQLPIIKATGKTVPYPDEIDNS
ncbi:MAG TPA: sulfatase [Arachidicoccus soli]|nr:sulfatase [Arachidicoccus soli]